MYFLRSGIPFVRFLLIFMAGLFSAIHYKWTVSIFYVGSALAVYCLVLYLEKRKIRIEIVKSILAYGILFLLGWVLVKERTETFKSSHYIHSLDSIQFYKAEIISVPEHTEKTNKAVAMIRSFRNNSSGWINSEGKVLLYLQKDSSMNIAKGDIFFIKGNPSPPSPPANPEQFDYAAYLRRQNIYTVHFVKKGSFIKTGYENGNFIVNLADRLRFFCEEKIKSGIKRENECQLTIALLLGIRAGLDEKLAGAYSSTGTVHALAVSGLHVSLIYFIVVTGFGFIKKIRYGKYIFAIISILIFWFYALVTGFSPSVIRAVAMFSVVLLAGLVKRNSGIYNTLAFSAFVILCIEPFWVMDIGFQFSFLAVVGIAYIYPVFYSWIETKNWIKEKLWSLVCISLAAQIAVSPLSIYYFHSFPLLFLPFNMIIVPLSSLALYTGLAGLMLYKIGFLSNLAFLFTEYLVRGMNEIVILPIDPDYLKADFLYLTILELILIYLFICFLFFSLKNRKYKSFLYSMLWLLLFCSSLYYNTILKNESVVFTLYQVKGTTAVSLIHGGNAIVLSDNVLSKENKIFKFSIYNHLAKERVKQVFFSSFQNKRMISVKEFSFGQLIVWQGMVIIRANREGEYLPQELLNKADLLVISNGVKFSKIKKEKYSQIVLIDSSVKENSSICIEEFFDIRKSGAFVFVR
jgi:competence protein ComEC